ncbi:GNAT family N-acetyltransferase [Kineosporia sp. NBRC 101731]|uniref:GNAT family N-acetyltransferase n=1 Tax=Kineosporia sp. NBRC 101731 TaxID=3032199 RepID=UPI0025538C8C|nr:GNAT family N-acetyltransferase [Kineosporia sp. NBRC 101731]
MSIRAALAEDLPVLPQIEWAAGERFREVGMDEIADDEPLSLAELDVYRAAGRVWVHVEDGTPVAYLLMDVVDELVHIEQVSVHPRAAHRGIGRGLIEHLSDLSAGQSLVPLTLTTFRDVPWNAPYYARLGFLPFTMPGPQLLEVRRQEAAQGLDRWPRVCMIRPAARR